MTSGWRKRRAARALERQLAYQAEKAATLRGHEKLVLERLLIASRDARARIEKVQKIDRRSRVLEVGSGAHGLIFSFGSERGIGVDPLAVEYAGMFSWQRMAATAAAMGEQLPFRDGSFDVVLCDNVIDHAEGPAAIVGEMVRVLKPGGLLYFTVNVHHPIYGFASWLHGVWNAAGVRFEITPFADHTVHLTIPEARAMLADSRLRIVTDSVDAPRERPSRHAGDHLKKIFFKNALFSAIAVRV